MAALGNAGTQFAETPQQTGLPEDFPLITHGQQAPAGDLRPETYYQANVAFQRDIGFSTTAEIAWVGNFGRNFWRLKDSNNIAPYAFADPKNLFNNEPITVNSDTARLRRYRQRSLSADRRGHAQLQRTATEHSAQV